MESQTMSDLQNLYLSASGTDEFQFHSGVSQNPPMPGDQAPWIGGEPPSIPWIGGEPPSIVDTVGVPPQPGTTTVPPAPEIPPGPATVELTELWDTTTTTMAMGEEDDAIVPLPEAPVGNDPIVAQGALSGGMTAMADQPGADMVGDGLWFDLG